MRVAISVGIQCWETQSNGTSIHVVMKKETFVWITIISLDIV